MFCEDVCLGTTCGIDKLRAIRDALSSKVVDQLNGNQELVMLTDFARESTEYQYKKCLQDRISDIASWQWVLEDLSERLQESIDALKYEHNAMRVVVDRLRSEMNGLSSDCSRRGAICPLTDAVEEAIQQLLYLDYISIVYEFVRQSLLDNKEFFKEFQFLRDQKKYFEKLIEELYKKTVGLEETKKRINSDVLNKKQALEIEEMSLNTNYENVTLDRNKNLKKGSPISRWEKSCAHLKKSGLKALCSAVITRKQVRGARIQLSISAQAFSLKVDVALRRRLHTNRIKLQDLNWQREEAVWDYNSLQEELTSAEMKILETMNQERVVESRLADRSQRPSRELTKDEVNRTLREEQGQLRRFLKELRNNIDRIDSLKNKLEKVITNIDCCAEDLMQVIGLDEERIGYRQGQPRRSDSVTTTTNNTAPAQDEVPQVREYSDQLTVIQEENEDDYPFDF